MKSAITEDHVEQAALDILQKGLGYDYSFGPNIAPDGKNPLRKNYSQVVLVDKLEDAIQRINPDIPKEAREESIKKILRISSAKHVLENKTFHKYLIEGVPVEYRKDGKLKSDNIYFIDFENSKKNEFLAVNQFTVIEKNINKRLDIIIFVNGLPLVVIELKNIADKNATITDAFNQLQTYKEQIPSLFKYNEILVISDGHLARAGTLTSNKEKFMPWKTIQGEESKETFELEILLRGMFEKSTFLDIIRHFIVFEEEKKEINKKLAAYHQYDAVNKAILSTIRASSMVIKEEPEKYGLTSVKNQPKGDKKAGIVWHTQGSGKSLYGILF